MIVSKVKILLDTEVGSNASGLKTKQNNKKQTKIIAPILKSADSNMLYIFISSGHLFFKL